MLINDQESGRNLQIATFRVGPLMLGLPIGKVKEINRQLETARVPLSPDYVYGITNLRGDVTTVIDLHVVLDIPAEDDRSFRYVIVNDGGQQLALLVDEIADILCISSDELSLPPANVSGLDGRFFEGVYSGPDEIVVILNLEEIANPETLTA